ncbi:MAG: DUF222 domain-containing protein [Actinomycetes bacterium]
MQSSGGAGPAVHDLDRGLALLRKAVDTLAGARLWSRSQDEVRAALAETTRLGHALEASRLALVRASASRDDGTRVGSATQAWMQENLHVTGGRARADIENARLVDVEDGDLRQLGTALARGEVSPQHVDVARQALTKLPTHLVSAHRAEIDASFAKNARTFTAKDFRLLASQVAAVLAPAREDRLDPFAHERQQAVAWRDATGMVQVSGQLAGEGGLLFKTVLDHLAAPTRPAGDGDQLSLVGTEVDARTPEQRTADALVEMARLAASHPDVGTRIGEPPRLVVHATVDQISWVPGSGATPPGLATCEGGGVISPGLLQRVACDAVLQIVVLDSKGAIVEMRDPGRLANRAMRRALAARDGGCAYPGCSAPPSWCEAHHVEMWSRGGRTVLRNLVLLCPRHHTIVHCGEWVIEMRHEVPWFIPPRHLDPGQRPIRNTVHTAMAEATALAQRLWHHGPEPPAPGDSG